MSTQMKACVVMLIGTCANPHIPLSVATCCFFMCVLQDDNDALQFQALRDLKLTDCLANFEMQKMNIAAQTTLAMIGVRRSSSDGLALKIIDSNNYHTIATVDFPAKDLVLGTCTTNFNWIIRAENDHDGLKVPGAEVKHPFSGKMHDLYMSPSFTKGSLSTSSPTCSRKTAHPKRSVRSSTWS